jgi:hypothetical protein
MTSLSDGAALSAAARNGQDAGVRFLILGAVLLAGCCAPACGSDAPAAPAGIFFPTVPIGGAYPSALLEGRLEERSGCLFAAADNERWLLLWPEGYSPRIENGRVEVLDGKGSLVAREGKELKVGGGENRPREVGGATASEKWATELTGVDIPERCGDVYWIVSPE